MQSTSNSYADNVDRKIDKSSSATGAETVERTFEIETLHGDPPKPTGVKRQFIFDVPKSEPEKSDFSGSDQRLFSVFAGQVDCNPFEQETYKTLRRILNRGLPKNLQLLRTKTDVFDFTWRGYTFSLTVESLSNCRDRVVVSV